MKLTKNIRLEVLALFLGVLLIYLINLSSSVYGGDSGDFLATAISRGVAHPSGYPLFTMLGILLTSLPLPLTYAFKFGLASALFASLSVVVVYLIGLELVKNRFIALVSALILAFIFPFWLYAEVVEVMSLNSFFILVLTYLTVKLLAKWDEKLFFILAFTTGLSFTNNLTIILVLPGIALALLISNRKQLLRVRRLLLAGLYFLLGLAPYIYVPIAARADPEVSWGVAKTFSNFISLVARQDYGWINTSIDKSLLGLHLRVYFDYWRVFINPTIAAVAVLGLASLINKKKIALLALLASGFILFGPFFVLYVRSPLQNYLSFGILEKFYVGGILFLCLFVPLGIQTLNLIIAGALKRPFLAKVFQKALLAVFFLVAVSQFSVNFPKTRLSGVAIGDNYGEDLLLSLPKNSILFLTRDTTAFNARYIQLAYGVRPDVYIPGKDVGFEALLKEAGVGEEIIERHNIEQKGGIDSALLKAIVPLILTKRPIFSEIEYESEDSPLGKIVSIPYGLLYKLEFESKNPLTKDGYLNTVDPILESYQLTEIKKNKDFINSHFVLADIKISYSLAYMNVAKYLSEHYHDSDTSAIYLKKALELDPRVEDSL